MTRTKMGALLLALTTIAWLMAATPALADHKDGHGRTTAGSGQTSDDKDTAAGKNGQPDPEPVQDEEKATRGNTSCENNAGKGSGGEYDSTCDGTVGRNGGGGNGKCAGCDGRADNKDPKGQSRNDNNNGYECDNNGGVAKGNPAHSRCKAPPAPPQNPPKPPNPPNNPPTCPDGRPMPPSGVCGGPIDRPVLPDEQERVLGLRFRGVPRIPAQVSPRRQRPGVLPFTGAGDGTAVYVLLGLGLMAAGGLMIRPRRKVQDEG